MKNLRKTIGLGLLLVMTITFLQAKSVDNNILPLKTSSTTYATTNRIFYELMYKIQHGKALQIEVASMSINKSRKPYLNSYTAYGKAYLVKENSTTLKTDRNVSMAFSDRNHFAGAKTLESIKIYGATNIIKVEIKLVTWGNKTIILRNVNIRREPQGYFITGRVTDGNRTVYYTLGIFEVQTII
jgi:hypothetical protein